MSNRELVLAVLATAAALGLAAYTYNQQKKTAVAAAAAAPPPPAEPHKPLKKDQPPPPAAEKKKPSTSSSAEPPPPATASVKKQQELSATKSELAEKESALGTKAFKSGEYSTAVEHFTRAIELCPAGDAGKKVMLNNRAAAREKMHDWDETAQDCTLALELDPQYRRALARRAKALECKQDLQGALRDLTLIRQLDAVHGEEENNEVLQAYERLTKQVGNAQAGELWRQKKQHQHLTASSVSGQDLKLPANIQSVRQYYYSFSQEAGRFRSPPAESALAAAREQLRHADAEAVLALAQMYKYRMDLRSAFDLFKECSQHKAASKQVKADALSELASIYHVSGDYLSAKDKLDQALLLAPAGSTRIAIKQALLAVEDGDFELAKQLAGTASPEDVYERADLGFHQSAIACIELGDLELAKELLEQALQGVPDYGLAHMQLGIIHYRLGNTEDALHELEQSCLLLPELAEVHNFHGEVLMSLSRRDEAVAKFMDSTAADEHCALPLLNRGVLYMQKEDPTQMATEEELLQAIALFDKAVEVDPSSEIAYVHRASYYGLLGQFDEALRNYEMAIERAKSLTDLQEYCAFRAACVAQRAVQLQFSQ